MSSKPSYGGAPPFSIKPKPQGDIYREYAFGAPVKKAEIAKVSPDELAKQAVKQAEERIAMRGAMMQPVPLYRDAPQVPWAREGQAMNPAHEVPVAAPFPPLNDVRDPAPPVPPPAAQAPIPEPAKPKLPSLKAFLGGPDEIEGSIWTVELIAQALTAELWRERQIEEVVKEGDLLALESEGGVRYERADGWKDAPITQEMIELHGATIFTLEGGGKPRKPIVIRLTSDFSSGMMSVPKGTRLKLPTDEHEARRFFGCDVFVTEVIDKGRASKCFCPVLTKMGDPVFRRVFSRIFPEFAKKTLRENIKDLIHGRGQGIRLKRGLSLKKLVRLAQPPYRKGDTHTAMTAEQIAQKVNLPVETIADLLAKQDYQRASGPTVPFIKRMSARDLVPDHFRYTQAIGIEIEAVIPMSREDAAKHVPSYVRVDKDGSIRLDQRNSENRPDEKRTWGAEFRLLIKPNEMEERVSRALLRIKGLKATVNPSCGLHIHFDMRGKTQAEFDVIHARVKKWCQALVELVPPLRRNNEVCTLAEDRGRNPHWEAVSRDSFKKHTTLEIRHHSATLNHIKVIYWIQLIQTLMETRFTPPPKTTTLDALKMLPLSDDDRAYWTKRHAQLAGQPVDLSFLGSDPHEVE